jgi:hypothetical protein
MLLETMPRGYRKRTNYASRTEAVKPRSVEVLTKSWGELTLPVHFAARRLITKIHATARMMMVGMSPVRA